MRTGGTQLSVLHQGQSFGLGLKRELRSKYIYLFFLTFFCSLLHLFLSLYLNIICLCEVIVLLCSSVDKKWTLLSSALSGLFCASLNFINPQQSLNPKYSFAPTGAYVSASQNRSLLRYSTLPREIVCTENLTPFKKLLPCDSKVFFFYF